MSKKQLTVVSTPGPLAPPAPWPNAKQLKQLADKLDALFEHYQRMWNLTDMWRERHPPPTEEELELARKHIANYERSAVRAALLNGELKRLHDACVPADWWGDDGEVRESAVARFVVILLGGFPNGPKDPEIFVPQMIEDVLLWDNPHFFALQDAGRALRNNQTWAPSTAELKKAYDNAWTQWQARWDAEDDSEFACEDLKQAIAKGEVRLAQQREAEAAMAIKVEQRRRYLEAKRAPLAVGDRVRHKDHGAGIIIDYPNKSNVCWVWWDALDRSWLVRFDQEADPVCVWAHHLERLVEGDEGFAPFAQSKEEEP